MRVCFHTASVVFALALTGSNGSAQVLESEMSAADAAFGDGFGGAIGLSLDTIAIGARGDDGSKGSAYVFRRGAGVWTQEAKLVPAAAVAGDQVGSSVGVSGNLAVVGAPDPFDPFGVASGPGTAYVYERTGSSWALDATLTAADGQSLDQFGHAAAIDVDRIAVGARGDEASGPGARFGGRGAVYVYRPQGAGWTQEQKLVGADSVSGDRFGSAVAISGTALIAGAPGNGGDGAAYVFRRSGTTWTQEAKLVASDGVLDDSFGDAVSISGDVAVVGAFEHDANGANAGAVYVFRRVAGVWSQQAKLTASDAAAGHNFGVSVSVAGEQVAVGAQGAEAVYRFANSGGWSQVGKLTLAGSVLLGAAVASSPDFVAAGEPLATGAGVLLAGEAAVWCVNPGPVLLSVSPTSGLFNQNTLVTLNGANFSPVKAKSVTFGGVAATNVTYVSANQLTCNAPTGTSGQTVSVVVTQNGSTSTLPAAFSYVAADLVSVSPASGPAAGGNLVNLNGTLFATDGSTTVTFGGAPASVQSTTATQIQVLAPAGSPGSTVNVAMTSNNGNDTLVGAYTYLAMSISGVNVSSGNFQGGQVITATITQGTNAGDTSVTLGGMPITPSSANATQVVFTTPATAAPTGTALDLTISNSNGSDTLIGAFTYTPALGFSVSGNTVAGGTVTVTWVTDPTAGGAQVVSLWLGDPLVPTVNVAIPGFAGLLHEVPYLFVVQAAAVAASPLALPFGPLPAAIAGFPFRAQALASIEGAANGSFSNVVTFSIP